MPITDMMSTKVPIPQLRDICFPTHASQMICVQRIIASLKLGYMIDSNKSTLCNIIVNLFGSMSCSIFRIK